MKIMVNSHYKPADIKIGCEMNIIGMKIDEVRLDGRLDRFKEDLQAIRAMGIQAVELPVHGLDAIINGRLSNRRMSDVLDILSEFDFTYSVHSPNPVNLMDKKNPELHLNVLSASLEFARQVHAKTVVYHCGRFIPEEDFTIFPSWSLPEREKEFLLERESILLQTIADQYRDVNIALENARPYLSQSPYTYAEFIPELRKQIESVNRDNVKMNLDIGHLHMTADFHQFDLLEAVRHIKDFVIHTHIHDNHGGTVHHYQKQQTHQLPFGVGDSHMPVGWGNIPVKDILDIILPDYKGLLMMELRSRYFNDITTSAENLKRIYNSCCE